jgi:transcriptional regulator with XRE-family HTH domain
MSTVGENILQMRKSLGWTQEELAQKMGYKSKSTINKIEMGINDIPQNKIVKFAEVLGTTPAHLMGWSENTKKPSPGEEKLTEGEKMWLELYHRLSGETRELLIHTMGAFDRLPKDKQKLALQMIRVALGDQE